MTLALGADIDFMLADNLGVDVVISGTTGRGMLDQSNVLENHDGVQLQVRVTTLLVRTGSFTLSDGIAVTADSASYKLAGWDLEDDGKLTRLILARAS